MSMSWVDVIVLAAVEGVTEFLPVSSTAHLMMTARLLDVGNTAFINLFLDAIQLGAITAIFVLYFKLFFTSLRIYYLLITAFIPTAIIGVLVKTYVHISLPISLVTGVLWILGGVVFLYVNSIFPHKKDKNLENISYKDAFIIGLIQCLALIPGVSRSGATIVGGLARSLTPYTAVLFAFLLGLPSTFAAVCKSFYDFSKLEEGAHFSGLELSQLIIANAISFCIALVVASRFIKYIVHYGFKGVGIYRIIIGALALIFYFTKFL